MKNLLFDFAMEYHYRMAKYHEKKFRHHAMKHLILFKNKYPDGLKAGNIIIDEMHHASAYVERRTSSE